MSDIPTDDDGLTDLRSEIDADVDPEWEAKYGDASWNAALVQLGLLPPDTDPDDVNHREPDERDDTEPDNDPDDQ